MDPEKKEKKEKKSKTKEDKPKLTRKQSSPNFLAKGLAKFGMGKKKKELKETQEKSIGNKEELKEHTEKQKATEENKTPAQTPGTGMFQSKSVGALPKTKKRSADPLEDIRNFFEEIGTSDETFLIDERWEIFEAICKMKYNMDEYKFLRQFHLFMNSKDPQAGEKFYQLMITNKYIDNLNFDVDDVEEFKALKKDELNAARGKNVMAKLGRFLASIEKEDIRVDSLPKTLKK